MATSMKIIDSHQHFWKYNPQNHQWITDDMKVIQKDFSPSDLKKVFEQHGIEGCVLVQVDQTEAETNHFLELARENSFIKGVVGWIDLQAENLEERLEHFSSDKKLKGFRHIVQGEADVNFLLRDDFVRGISSLEKYGFTYDILIFPHQLGAALELVRKFPNQKFVIDHLAKPYIKDQYYDGWANQIQAISRSENVYCKISGMVTEADWQNWKQQDFLPYLDAVYEAFGAGRLMYGSDWPVCLVAAEYHQVLHIIQLWTAGFTEDEKRKIMGQNAIDFYQLF